MTEFERTLLKVQELVAEATGSELDDVTAYTSLVDELGITEIDMARLVAELNAQFDIHLKPKNLDGEVETVYDLAVVVHEEMNLG